MSKVLTVYPSNNKIYDPSLKRWVGVKELAKRVYAGEKFSIINHETKVDETEAILEKMQKLVPVDNTETQLIKKYKNRKLYNMNENKYVSLSDIYEKDKKKESFKVLSHENKDITVQTVFMAKAKYHSETD